MHKQCLPEAVLAIRPGRLWPTRTRSWPTQTARVIPMIPTYTTPVVLPKMCLAFDWHTQMKIPRTAAGGYRYIIRNHWRWITYLKKLSEVFNRDAKSPFPPHMSSRGKAYPLKTSCMLLQNSRCQNYFLCVFNYKQATKGIWQKATSPSCHPSWLQIDLSHLDPSSLSNTWFVGPA